METGKACRGVTLIELCIVIAVLAALLGISWPVLRGVAAGSELENDCKRLSATILYARDSAIAENRRYRLSFDPQKHWYALSAESGEPGDFEPVGSAEFSTRKWSQNTGATDISGKELVFNPDGSAENFRIVLKNSKGRAIELTYDNLKGKCEISK